MLGPMCNLANQNGQFLRSFLMAILSIFIINENVITGLFYKTCSLCQRRLDIHLSYGLKNVCPIPAPWYE